VGGQAVPQQRGLLAAEKAAQRTKDVDQAVGVVVARLDMEGELGAAAAVAVALR
jgi:hypothetical protein